MMRFGLAHPCYAALWTDRLFGLMADVKDEAATRAHPRPVMTRGRTVCRLVFPCYDSFYAPLSRYKEEIRQFVRSFRVPEPADPEKTGVEQMDRWLRQQWASADAGEIRGRGQGEVVLHPPLPRLGRAGGRRRHREDHQ